MGWKGNDPFAHVVAVHPSKRDAKSGGEKDKSGGKQKWKQGSSAKQSEPNPASKGKGSKKAKSANSQHKGKEPKAKSSSSGDKGQTKGSAPKHNRCYTCDKEGHRMADCPDAPAKEKQTKNE